MLYGEGLGLHGFEEGFVEVWPEEEYREDAPEDGSEEGFEEEVGREGECLREVEGLQGVEAWQVVTQLMMRSWRDNRRGRWWSETGGSGAQALIDHLWHASHPMTQQRPLHMTVRLRLACCALPAFFNVSTVQLHLSF